MMYDHGKPLWKFNRPEQLVCALTIALSGHETLCDHSILHGDISAGNILIRMDGKQVGDEIVLCERPVEETEGFLTDFQFASLPDDGAERGDSGEREMGTMELSAVSDEITGTAMFMSSELLEAVRKGQSISRMALQDVESFAWVVIYILYKHAVDISPPRDNMALKKGLHYEFNNLFGGTSAEDVLSRRLTFLRNESTNLCKYYKSEYAKLHGSPDAFTPLKILCLCLAKQLPPLVRTLHASAVGMVAEWWPGLQPIPEGGEASHQTITLAVPSASEQPLTHDRFLALLRGCMNILNSGNDDVSE